MPSKLKRINLTLPDDVYDALQKFKLYYGLDRDASAVLSIIRMRLRNEGFLMDDTRKGSNN